MDAPLPAAPGDYLLVLRLAQPAGASVGALGRFDFPAGWYLYAGSARGPGGLAARVGRHWGGGGRRRWHLDYLRPVAAPVAVWWGLGDERRECVWARELAAWPSAAAPARGFGASDCRCLAHLWWFASEPARPSGALHEWRAA